MIQTARGIEDSHPPRTMGRRPVAQHGSERDDPAAACDQLHGTGVGVRPHKMALGWADLQRIPNVHLMVQVVGEDAMRPMAHRERDVAVFGGGGQPVAASDVGSDRRLHLDILTGLVTGPRSDVENDADRLMGLTHELDNGGRPEHLSLRRLISHWFSLADALRATFAGVPLRFLSSIRCAQLGSGQQKHRLRADLRFGACLFHASHDCRNHPAADATGARGLTEVALAVWAGPSGARADLEGRPSRGPGEEGCAGELRVAPGLSAGPFGGGERLRQPTHAIHSSTCSAADAGPT